MTLIVFFGSQGFRVCVLTGKGSTRAKEALILKLLASYQVGRSAGSKILRVWRAKWMRTGDTAPFSSD